MIKTLIIEDEPFAQDELKRLLAKHEGIHVIDTLETVAESVNWLKSNPKPDLIFLDIQLADGLSFEIFDEVQSDVPIIFTTAYDEYAIQAFRLNSIDYLLKPIEEAQLSRALEKHSKLKTEPMPWQDLKSILLSKTIEYKQRFLSKRGDKLLKIEANDVVMIWASDGVVWLTNNEGKDFIIDDSLEKIETVLDPKSFFRISRSHMVSYNAVLQAHKHFNGRLKLDLTIPTSEEVFVSRSKCREFMQWLEM